MEQKPVRRANLAILFALTFLIFSLTICWAQEPKGPPHRAVSAAKAAAAKAVPRTKDGHPDLDGIWTNVTLTPLERPDEFAGKATATEEEADKYENRNVSRERTPAQRAAQQGVGGYNALFIDKGTQLARVDGVKRTSLIIDPPDGKIPPLTPEARKRAAARAAAAQTYSGPEVRPLGERCVLGFGSTSGPPMLPVLYNNNYQFIETPGAFMILVEMVHDVRVIHMDGRPHLAANVREWMGDSIGHWEGETLVVDTTNFTDKTRFRGSGENLHVVERFNRVDANTILYRVTIEDPSSFARPWTAEYPFLATAGPIFEYACHEGNYAMTDILGGARHQETTAKEK
jgi:hypothetical protein